MPEQKLKNAPATIYFYWTGCKKWKGWELSWEVWMPPLISSVQADNYECSVGSPNLPRTCMSHQNFLLNTICYMSMQFLPSTCKDSKSENNQLSSWNRKMGEKPEQLFKKSKPHRKGNCWHCKRSLRKVTCIFRRNKNIKMIQTHTHKPEENSCCNTGHKN